MRLCCITDTSIHVAQAHEHAHHSGRLQAGLDWNRQLAPSCDILVLADFSLEYLATPPIIGIESTDMAAARQGSPILCGCGQVRQSCS